MNFSICIPTRERPNNIKRLVSSILDLAHDPDKVELIFRLDADDSTVPDVIQKHGKIVTKKRPKCMSDLWEDCYPLATADRVMMCADDAVFRTQDWDKTIYDMTPDPGNHFYFIWGNDLIQCRGLATFPIMSRAWINEVGYFIPRGYLREWCDTHVHDIANRLNKLGYDVRFYFAEVIFEHMHPNAGKAKNDNTYRYRYALKGEEGQYRRRSEERQKIAAKLARKIKRGVYKLREPYGFKHLRQGHNEASSWYAT